MFRIKGGMGGFTWKLGVGVNLSACFHLEGRVLGGDSVEQMCFEKGVQESPRPHRWRKS